MSASPRRIPAEERPALTKHLEKLIEPPGFTGNAPGGPSRWNTERSAEWQPLKPELVVEVRYDQVTGRRFRHGTGFLRWRPDKDPKQCTFEQLAPELRAVRAQGAVRRDELRLTCSTAPLIAGLDYRDELISASRGARADRAADALDLAPFRFHGWLGNRKTQSFGWRYDFDDASFAPAEPIPDWLQPLRDKAAAFAGLSRRTISSTSCSPATIPAPASAGTATATCSRRSSASRSARRRRCASASARRRGFRRASLDVAPRSAYLLVGRSALAIGSTASRPASSCASRSPSGPCRTRAAAPRHVG